MMPTTINAKGSELATEGVTGYNYECQQNAENSTTYLEWLQFDVTKDCTKTKLLQLLEDRPIKAFCDGSFISSKNIGTAAWTITTNTYSYEDVKTVGTLVLGTKNRLSPFCCKL